MIYITVDTMFHITYTFYVTKKLTNIKGIAKMADLSIATVSRVMNHPELVKDETRQKVLDVIEQNDYKPNQLARGLIMGKTNIIALIVPDIESTFYQMILSGVETVALDKGYNVFICNTHSDPKVELDYIYMAINKRVDGIVLADSNLNHDQTEILNSKKIAFVHIGKKDLSGCENRCFIDSAKDANKLTRHMLSMGHKTINLLLNKESKDTNYQFIKGYAAALSRDPEAVKKHIHYCDNKLNESSYSTSRIISKYGCGTAIIAATDVIAYGVLRAAQKNNLKVPEDVALGSLVDSPINSLVSPPITSVDAPSKRLGMVASRMLFDTIDEPEYEGSKSQEVILQSILKIRKSCGNIKNIYELRE
jgi:LacI family transcriptional regulator